MEAAEMKVSNIIAPFSILLETKCTGKRLKLCLKPVNTCNCLHVRKKIKLI